LNAWPFQLLRHCRNEALFNSQDYRIEMRLQATSDVSVNWPNHERSFAAGKRIHSENFYKQTPAFTTVPLQQAGFSQVQHWTDRQG